MLRKYGEAITEDLVSKQHVTRKYTQEERKQIKEYYRGRIRELEQGNPPRREDTGVSVLDMFKGA